MAYATHLILLFDDAGTVTGLGRINQEELDKQGGAQIYCSAENRHFARLELSSELKSLIDENISNEEIMERFAISHTNGLNAKLVEKSTVRRKV